MCEQQRRSSACASAQSDQRLCCSLLWLYNIFWFYSWNFKTLASFFGCAGRFVSSLVGDSWRHVFSWRGSVSLRSFQELYVNRNSGYSTKTAKLKPGAVARLDARPPGMRTVAGSILTSDKTYFRWDLVMKKILRPFSPFRWFKKGSCKLLAKEWALSTGKLPRKIAQEHCG